MKRSAYRDRNYAFGQAMLTLCTNIGLIQAGLADYLHVSGRAVGEWGLAAVIPKSNILNKLIVLGIKQQAFPAGREAEAVRELWQISRQKVLLDENWLAGLLTPLRVKVAINPPVPIVAVTLVRGILPRLSLPTAVLEILAGIIIGPAGLHFAQVDSIVATLSLIGLAFLLFLAGTEIAFETLGSLIKPAALSFTLSLALAISVSYGLPIQGLIKSPLLLAITLSATALGIVVGVLKQASQTQTTFGQLVIASASVADFGTVILLALFFSRESGGIGIQLLLVSSLLLFALLVVIALRQAEQWKRLRMLFSRLNANNSEVLIGCALLLMISFVALAERLGLEVILGAFIAGAIIGLVDHEDGAVHREFRQKLDAIGYGLFIPIFMVTTGMRFDIGSLLADKASLTLIPLLLGLLLLVRGIPALLYWRLLGGRGSFAAGLFQATSLAFILTAVQIGIELKLMSQALGAALTAVGLLSVLLFPLGALTVLSSSKKYTVVDAK